ncbi:unnamed protein product [Linum tenue]|uniref:Uncharacterized protein n=1 Tax=Linum tenue TaxID=586396 RepID=A0AAV0R3U8_9ROSI|nr:unnamed protein product [Linum tenue]
MKNPYKKGKIHPSPSPPTQPPPTTATFLSLLPAAVLALTAALSPQDKEVLAYLISCCSDAAGHRNKRKTTTACGDGKPTFECSCFRCYMTFWGRWDASSNRHLIHEIIEAYEAAALTCHQKRKTRKGDRRRRGKDGEFNNMGPGGRKPESADQVASPDASYEEEEDGRSGGGDEVDLEKSAVRKIVSFVGDRIIGIFGGV